MNHAFRWILLVLVYHLAFVSTAKTPSSTSSKNEPSTSTSELSSSIQTKPSKILMLLPFASQSHRNCFLPLANSLAEKGHKVVILSPLPPKAKHPNIREINHGVAMSEDMNMFNIRETDPSLGFGSFKFILPDIARGMYKHPEVKEIYEKRDEFDTFIIDGLFNEIAYPFLVGKAYISIDTAGILPGSSATLGNVLNPSYVPSVLNDFKRPYSFFNRISNVFGHLFLPIYWRHYEMFPLLHNVLQETFPDLPPLAEIEEGLALVLANTHFSLDAPLPLLPSQVEVGGMHCRPGKQLPQDLHDFIEQSGTEGVVYFSLGSVCKGKSLPEKYKKIVVEGFKKLKQRVIWKFEEEFKDLPKTILIKDWMPQQDILAHPKVKLFITHGGLLSMQESLFHGKPLLALPIFGDQERNCRRITNNGFGECIMWEELTVENFVETINNLITNPVYNDRVKNVSTSFRDQPQSPLERAVWWTEYVIRHKGAPQLKCPAAELSWIEYLMIDVIISAHILVILAYFIIKLAVKKLMSMCAKTPSKKMTEKKRK